MNVINKQQWIVVRGAREHNLKNITVQIPKYALTVITGPSGSGKSSLALDVLYTEGKRRYLESLSSYARQFLGAPTQPDVDAIEGLCPAIAIEQKTVGHNPRSTVGTITEIHDYLRVLWARIGTLYCPECIRPVEPIPVDQLITRIQERWVDQKITIIAPLVQDQKGSFVAEIEQWISQGITQFIIDGKKVTCENGTDVTRLKLNKKAQHRIWGIIDTVSLMSEEHARVAESIERACSLTNGSVIIRDGHTEYLFSTQQICTQCMNSVPEREPRLFSFNSPIGACAPCAGLGVLWNERASIEQTCQACQGERLNRYARAVRVGNITLPVLEARPLTGVRDWAQTLTLDAVQREIAHSILEQIQKRVQFLCDVGVGYIALNRTARTLSGGEGQRIRLATQIGAALTGTLYVLDEPSIGLHQRDNDRLIQTLKQLRDQGNTVVVVEHDTDTINSADYVIDMGPAAGVHGGAVTAAGTVPELQADQNSLTGAYLAGRIQIAIPEKRRTPTGWLTVTNASKYNLKNITVKFPLGVLCGVSGVSGSGKSTLVLEELVQQAMHASQKTVENLVVIDQAPIGRTPRSNPATYTGIFDMIRALFAQMPESKIRGYTVGRFSFNTTLGQCGSCKGDGTVTVSMHLLPDVILTCRACKGLRYNPQTLEIRYKNKTIADILALTATEAVLFFEHHRAIAKRVKLLCDVGLGYLTLGQSATTLSGGEAQRIKLVLELAKRGQNTLYILDEPTTGLHTHDCAQLLRVLNSLVDKGNSVILIEHNLDILANLDYLIDVGPEGGDAGGTVVAMGTPEVVSQSPQSHTGNYLQKYFYNSGKLKHL